MMNELPKCFLSLLVLAILLVAGCESTPNRIYTNEDELQAELDAIEELETSAQRIRHLERFASRRGIDPRFVSDFHEYLVDTIFENLGSDKEKIHILKKLINNPEFSVGAKSNILYYLDELELSSDRELILMELDRRGPVGSGVEAAGSDPTFKIEMPDGRTLHVPVKE